MNDISSFHQNLYEQRYQSVKTIVPPSAVPAGKHGAWKIRKFTIKKDELGLTLLRSIIKHERGYTPPGDYTKLVHAQRGVIMSDTLDELTDHVTFVRRARGNVLINGLGLGICTAAVLAKPEVTGVTVIELEKDVISLVEPHLKDPRLTVICADARQWSPPQNVKYDAVWHDIWDTFDDEEFAESKTLHRRYGRRAAWQGSWGRTYYQSRY